MGQPRRQFDKKGHTEEMTYNNKANSGLANNLVSSIAIDKDNILWIGTRAGGLARFDGTNSTVFNSDNSGLADNLVYVIATDEDNIKWMGTGGGLGVYQEGG